MQVDNIVDAGLDVELLALMDQIENQPDISEFISDEDQEDWATECFTTCKSAPSDYLTMQDVVENRPDILDELDLRYKLASKLGWTDMPMGVALPAIEAIMRNHHFPTVSPLSRTANQLFGLLLGDDDVSYEDYSLFISLRHEIETEMRSGLEYQNAINERYK